MPWEDDDHIHGAEILVSSQAMDSLLELEILASLVKGRKRVLKDSLLGLLSTLFPTVHPGL
jgi:hypothetical protein